MRQCLLWPPNNKHAQVICSFTKKSFTLKAGEFVAVLRLSVVFISRRKMQSRLVA
jgi:hypothetical protein